MEHLGSRPTDHMGYRAYLIDWTTALENRTDRLIREAPDGTGVIAYCAPSSYSVEN